MKADSKTTVAGILFALAGVVASLPPFPVWRDWNSTHIAMLISALAGGAGFHLAADASRPVKKVLSNVADQSSTLP